LTWLRRLNWTVPRSKKDCWVRERKEGYGGIKKNRREGNRGMERNGEKTLRVILTFFGRAAAGKAPKKKELKRKTRKTDRKTELELHFK